MRFGAHEADHCALHSWKGFALLRVWEGQRFVMAPIVIEFEVVAN